MTERPTVIRGGLVLYGDGHASLQDVLIKDGLIALAPPPISAQCEKTQ